MPLLSTKILVLNVNREGWHSGNMLYDMRAIEGACDVKFYGPGWPDYTQNRLVDVVSQLYGADKPDIIYSYFEENEKIEDVYLTHFNIPEHLRVFPTGLSDIKGVTKIFAVSDFWKKKYSDSLFQSGFEFVFSCFAPPFSNSKHFFRYFDPALKAKLKFIGHPRCVDELCYKDYQLPKENDVITVGAMDEDFYPLRLYIHSFLQENGGQLGINYKNYPHCGFNYFHSGFVREEYAQAINRAEILISCGGVYRLAFNKIFESMGCRTVYMGERPFGAEELHLVDGYNYVAVTRGNFRQRLVDLLNDRDKLAMIAANGQKTFLAHHTIRERSKGFVRLLYENGLA